MYWIVFASARVDAKQTVCDEGKPTSEYDSRILLSSNSVDGRAWNQGGYSVVLSPPNMHDLLASKRVWVADKYSELCMCAVIYIFLKHVYVEYVSSAEFSSSAYVPTYIVWKNICIWCIVGLM